jgi:hypothetical protein
MTLLCIKHPYEKLSFDICSKCLESIPSEEQADVIQRFARSTRFTIVWLKVQDSHNGNE